MSTFRSLARWSPWMPWIPWCGVGLLLFGLFIFFTPDSSEQSTVPLVSGQPSQGQPGIARNNKPEAYFHIVRTLESEWDNLLGVTGDALLPTPTPTTALQNYVESHLIRRTDRDCATRVKDFQQDKRIQLPGFPPAQVGIDFQENPFQSRTWELSYHGFLHLPCLFSQIPRIDAYRTTREWVRSWQSANSVLHHSAGKPPPYMAWDDHAVAVRLASLSWIIATLGDEFATDPGFRDLVSFAAFHAALAMKEGFFYEKHNHGMFQAVAVLYFTDVLPNLPSSQKLRELASARIFDYFHYAFSDSGVHKEHSAGYHMGMRNHLVRLLPIIAPFLEAGSLHFLQAHIDRSEVFGFHITQPNGSLVPFGDTAQPMKGFSLRAAQERKIPVAGAYPADGYISVRSSWGNEQSDWHLFFQNAFFSRVHKHQDNLSFTYYAAKRPWVIDSGVSPYRADAHRTHCLGPYAHSTIILNEQPIDFTGARTENHKTEWDDKAKRLVGSHQLYPNMSISRAIQILSNDALLVQDDIRSLSKTSPPVTAEFLFPFASDLHISKAEDSLFSVQEKKRNFPRMQVRLCDTPESLVPLVVQGQTTPRREGWMYHRQLGPQANAVLHLKSTFTSTLRQRYLFQVLHSEKSDSLPCPEQLLIQ